MINSELIEELAPTGKLRAGINLSNFLLVSEKHENGSIDGVSPQIAKAIADELGVELALIHYEGPGDVADAAQTNEWDIANIAAEAERAKFISFSKAYCEIQATYLLPPKSTIKTIADVDKPGVRIAVKNRAAYDLWLGENLKHANLVKAATLDESFTIFEKQNLDVLAGLRPKLLEQQQLMEGSFIFEESFTSVQQSIGCQIDKPLASQYLQDFVTRAKQDGLVERLINQFNVNGRLSVAP